MKPEFPEYTARLGDNPVVYTPVGYDEDEQSLQVTEKKVFWFQSCAIVKGEM